jgi:imidazolonepropionase
MRNILNFAEEILRRMILIRNIKELIQVEESARILVPGKEMSDLGTLKDAWLLIAGDRIIDFGPSESEPTPERCKIRIAKYEQEYHQVTGIQPDQLTIIDASGKLVFPSFCDSHTHLVFDGSREIEYIDKIRGLSYEEIAKRGGGILNSAKRLHESSESELILQALPRLNEIMCLGTGAVEIKSGYGLSVEDELKMLRVINMLEELTPLIIVPTFLAAHAVPSEFKGRQDEFVNLVINEMIPQVAAEELADYIDVFCDRGFFTIEETDRILLAGMKHGMRPKIHANELDFSGGIQVGVKYNALSVDHLEYTSDEEIKCLLGSETMPTVLPGAAFFLGMKQAPVRKMMEAGLPIALASDFNPGSSPSGNMQLILSLACINYRMLPEEAINAVTLNSAYAMGLSEELGSIARGKRANLFITKPIPGYEFMPYAYGSNKVDKVILNGQVQDI